MQHALPFRAGLAPPLFTTKHCLASVVCSMQGLDYLHYNKALHGDLKPANLLLSSERLVKIADFGSAMMYQESEGTWEGPVNGTPAFRPPETLTASGRLTRKVPLNLRQPSGSAPP